MFKNYDSEEVDLSKSLDSKPSKKESIWDLVRFTIIAILIVAPIRMFIAQPFIVNGKSMDPTFKNGDYLIVDEISYRFSEPKKDDVIVFRFPSNTSRFLIKRIAGLPGETIEVEGKTYTLGDDEYFVLGDNRPVSSDSRTWGSLDSEFIIGRAFLRLWPFNTISVLPGQD